MQFTPISEEEATKAAAGYLLKPGECDFDVREAIETTSNTTGNPMIKLTLNVWDSNGKQATVFDYLLEAMGYKMRHFAYAVGLGHDYESGELHAANFSGKGGRCIIENERGKDGYGDKNKVKDYVIADATKKGENYQRAKQQTSETPESLRNQAWKMFCKTTIDWDGDTRKAKWFEAMLQLFGHEQQEKLTANDWKRMLEACKSYDPAKGVPLAMRKPKQPILTPPLDDQEQFKEDDIPF